MKDEQSQRITAEVVGIYRAIRSIEPGALPVITRAAQVHDQLTGLLYAIHQIGIVLDELGGQPLVHKVTLAVEDTLDDVNAAVFLNRRWDGYPRS